eukprot:gene2625-2869_t
MKTMMKRLVLSGRFLNHAMPRTYSCPIVRTLRPFSSVSQAPYLSSLIDTKRSHVDPVTNYQSSPSVLALRSARDEGRSVTVKDFLVAMKDLAGEDFPDTALALWAFDSLKAGQIACIVPIEAYTEIIKVFSKANDYGSFSKAKAVVQSFEESGYKYHPDLLLPLLTFYGNRALSDETVTELLRVYSRGMSDLRERNQRLPDITLYLHVAWALVRMKRSEKAVTVLRDMINDRYEPTAALCLPLLHQCLFMRNVRVLGILASWFSDRFQHRLEYGQITRMLQIAASHNDGQLALVAFQMISKNSYTPSFNDYISLVRALLLSKDVISAIEALQEAEAKHKAILGDPAAQKHLISLRSLFAEALRSVEQIDTFYLALVDQVRSTQQPASQVVLDAMVIALGLHDQLDRALEVFLEYETTFLVKPTLESYNALLIATIKARDSQPQQWLDVFKRMEEAGFTPNEGSYSLLINRAVDFRDRQLLEPLVKHILDTNVQLWPFVWRRLATSLSWWKKHDVTVDAILERLEVATVSRTVPPYFFQRLENIRKKRPGGV